MKTEDKMAFMYIGVTFFRYVFWAGMFFLATLVITKVIYG